MPRYNYECLACKHKALVEYTDQLTGDVSVDDVELPYAIYEERVLFETYHSLDPTQDELNIALKCPRCGSLECNKTMYGVNISGYIRGYGFLDKAGATRDMHRYKLMNEDPYAQHRTPGEVEHISDTLKKQGQYDPKTKYFQTASSKDNDSK